MSTVNIRLNLPDARTIAVTLPAGEIPRRLAPALVSKLELPLAADGGDALAYFLAWEGGQRLEDDIPLDQASVTNGATLTLAVVAMPSVDGRWGEHDVYAPEPTPTVAPPAAEVAARRAPRPLPRRRRGRWAQIFWFVMIISLCRWLTGGFDTLFGRNTGSESFVDGAVQTAPAPEAYVPRPPASLVVFQEHLFVIAQQPDGWHLYRSATTQRVAEEVMLLGPPGASGSSAGLVVVEKRLFFTTFDQNGAPLALYQMATAVDPPAVVTADLAGATSACPIILRNLLYVGRVSGGRVTLVGAAGGTTRTFTDLTVGDAWCRNQVVAGSRLYFTASQFDSGEELWRYDEGESAAQLVSDLQPGALGSAPAGLLPVSDQLFFMARTNGAALWRLAGGADDAPELVFAGSVEQQLPSVGRLYFAGRSGSASTLYRFDLRDGRLDALPFAGAGERRIVALFFFAARLHVVTNGEQGYLLWQLAGNDDSLVATGALAAGPLNAANQFTAAGERFFFAGGDDLTAKQIWMSDGTPSGTVALDAIVATDDDNPVFLTAVGSVLFYVAADAQGVRALYRSDGTQAGTWQVAFGG